MQYAAIKAKETDQFLPYRNNIEQHILTKLWGIALKFFALVHVDPIKEVRSSLEFPLIFTMVFIIDYTRSMELALEVARKRASKRGIP